MKLPFGSSHRRALLTTLAGVTLVLTAGCSATGNATSSSSDSVTFGISAPRTGPSAEYGKYWEQGFQIALDEINAGGGIGGKKLALTWEDSQSDPKQSVPIAQKFVADPAIVAELGDFSSGASMAASSVYQQAGLVQFGFTNSNAAFTKGGDRMWTTSLTQDYYQRVRAQLLAKQFRTVSVLYLQTDWGKTSFDAFAKYADAAGLRIVYSSPIQADSQDYRPVLIKARDAQPDAVVHIGYGPDGALVVKQLRSIGYTKPFSGGQVTQQFLDLAGPAAEGTILTENFIVNDPSPRVQDFVGKFRAKFGTDPGAFNIYAYDALNVVAEAARRGGATREGIFSGLNQGKPFPSVQFGDFTFNSERRPNEVPLKPIVVSNGRFALLPT